MFVITPDRRVLLTRGDTAEINLRLYNRDGVEVAILPSDVITFIVKRDLASQALITKTANINKIFLEESDTDNLQLGYYYYQVDLLRDGEINTIVQPTLFELREEL